MQNPARAIALQQVDTSRLEPFLEVPGVLFCLVDAFGNLIQNSPAWQGVLGYSPEDLKTINLNDLVHPEDLERTLGDEPWIDRPSEQDGYTNRCRHKDGSYRWIRWQSKHRPDLDATYLIGVNLTSSTDAAGLRPDVSAKSTYRPSDQILFEANPNPMWVYDRETLRFLEVNDAAIEHYGYSRSEFLTKTILDIRPAEDKDAVWASVRRHPAEERPCIWTHRLKNGEHIKVEVLVRNIEYQGYRARLATIKDVTEQQKARTELQRNNELLEQRVADRTRQLLASNRELEAFCFSVSHDLRAPLRAIDGFSHSVIKTYGHLLNDEGREDLERVRKASQKMSELIDAMLGLARLTRQELSLQVVDLTALARQINDEINLDLPHRQAQVRIQENMEVLADPKLMHLLLQNLFSNAWKFTANQPKAEIVFEARESAGELVYAIRDNGAGFDMAYSDKLFQPFQRLHHASEFPGNGVGLATVNRIVSRHGGRVFAHGNVGHGATIYFTLKPSQSH